jgi:ADP-ribose pyrophosphatase YjhB (NUDIX family)
MTAFTHNTASKAVLLCSRQQPLYRSQLSAPSGQNQAHELALEQLARTLQKITPVAGLVLVGSAKKKEEISRFVSLIHTLIELTA